MSGSSVRGETVADGGVVGGDPGGGDGVADGGGVGGDPDGGDGVAEGVVGDDGGLDCDGSRSGGAGGSTGLADPAMSAPRRSGIFMPEANYDPPTSRAENVPGGRRLWTTARRGQVGAVWVPRC
jgi:hypothetical protein